jgi:2-aminoadipate transaminase
VYVVAEFDNPSGVTLSAERRHALVDLAERYGFLIVDDDPYGALRWQGEAPPPLSSLSDRIVTLGTTSKILAPGLRVGWAVAPADLAADLVVLKQAADLHTSSLSQQLAASLLTRPGFLQPQLQALRTRYQAQAGALQQALRTDLGDRLEFHTPDGGMFLWAQLTDGQQSKDLLPKALEHGVAFVPGEAFSVEDPHEQGLRLSFATASPTDLEEAVHRLANAFDP